MANSLKLYKMKKYLLVLFLFFTLTAYGQPKQKVTEADYQNQGIAMADQFREEGKIYVVVAILTTVLAGFIFYAIRIDRKVTRLEKELKK